MRSSATRCCFQIDASDPDHDGLKTSYAVDDHFVFDGSTWNYIVEDTGLSISVASSRTVSASLSTGT